jgi:hypothetical protein
MADQKDPHEIIDAFYKAIAEGQKQLDDWRNDPHNHPDLRLSIETEPVPTRMPPPQLPTLSERIALIIQWEAAGKNIHAALGLAHLQQDLGLDEPGWEIFVREHFPFSLARADELIGRMVRRGGLLLCSKCGAEALPQCTCGAPYHWEHQLAPTASQTGQSALERALDAVAASPRKPLRVIAREIGVSHETVRRARAALKRGGRL